MTLSKGAKVAVLVANGFNENHFISLQKIMIETGCQVKIISMNQGLVNGWNEEDNSWGHNYAVDTQLNGALGVDYDGLIIPGGQRSLDKLKMTAHTRRFVTSFMNMKKPVCVMADAYDVMVHTQMVDSHPIANDDKPAQMVDMVVSGKCDDEFYGMMMALFSEDNMNQAA